MNLPEHWYRGSLWLWLLWPLSLLFCLLVHVRRLAYQRYWLASTRLAVPVIVVGNITVGGSGKTPLVLWLADFLRSHGYRPGLISRGYGGQATQWPQTVAVDSDPAQVGDEALLLARRSGCPMLVGPDRVAAGRALLERHPEVNIIISDDGMQHYRLQRTIEIAVLDGERRLGNRQCLPSGPLRELPSRLQSVDFVVVNGRAAAGEVGMRLQADDLHSLCGDERLALETLAGKHVHAVAGIGHPRRFFSTLQEAGVEILEHPFADHHPYQAGELAYADELPVLMTEKDAVKYQHHADERHWYLPVTAHLPEGFGQQLLARLERKNG